MKSIITPAIVAAGLAFTLAVSAGQTFAQTPDPVVLAPVTQLADAFNKNDAAGIMAAHVPAPVILDEFAPYSWSGPTAVMDWGAGFAKYAAGIGMVGGTVQINPPSVFEVNGDHAYVVSPSVITFVTKDKPIKNAGTFSFALLKTPGGWRIQSWAYARGAALP